MAAPIRPAARLIELARQHGNSIPTLARVIERSPAYLRRRLRGTYGLDIRRSERETLAAFFGVPVRELGG